jgi:HEAT repeat protein
MRGMADTGQLITDLGSKDRRKRDRALSTLASRGEAVVPVLCEALKVKDRLERIGAAEALGEIAAAASVLPLCLALQDRDAVVRERAAAALVRIGEPAVLPLCGILGTASLEGRRRAAMALGRIADGRAVRPLCRALGDPDSVVRWRAAQALGSLAHREPTPALRTALPALRRLSSFWSLEGSEAKEAYEATAREIERVTEENKDLPLPSGAASPRTAGLAVPSALPPVSPEAGGTGGE